MSASQIDPATPDSRKKKHTFFRAILLFTVEMCLEGVLYVTRLDLAWLRRLISIERASAGRVLIERFGSPLGRRAVRGAALGDTTRATPPGQKTARPASIHAHRQPLLWLFLAEGEGSILPSADTKEGRPTAIAMPTRSARLESRGRQVRGRPRCDAFFFRPTSTSSTRHFSIAAGHRKRPDFINA